MQEAALSMQTLIEDLLTYARANSEERRFENIDLGTIIDEVQDELKESIEEKAAVIEVTELCEANIIRFQFRQLIHNIISNALKFSIPGKPPLIRISAVIKPGKDCMNDHLGRDLEYCHIRITDNGIGFESIYREKIFEVFQRLYGRETYKGTGIGLAIAKRIVDNHDGYITADGELNKGATFDIYIPTTKKPQHG
jgi:signal transduction histidine kinase